MKLLTALLIVGLASPVFASGGDGAGNAGDPIALEFTETAKIGMALVRGNPSMFPEISNTDVLTTTLEHATIYVVDEAGPIEKNQVTQRPTASNNPEKQSISIYRAGWNSEISECAKQATALHELLGLTGVELTGDYHISQRLVGICQASLHDEYRNLVMTTLNDFADNELRIVRLSSLSSSRSSIVVSDYYAYKLVEERLAAFEKTADAFRSLPLQFQLDVLASGAVWFVESKLGTGSSSVERGLFLPMEQWLAHDLRTLVLHTDSVLSLYLNEPTVPATMKKKLAKLVTKSKRLVEFVDHESDPPQNGRTVRPTTPYTDYQRAAVLNLRKAVAQQHCIVPSTFKLHGLVLSGAKKTIQDSLNMPDPDLQSERTRAESAGNEFAGLTADLEDQWKQLIDTDKIDRIQLKGHMPEDVSHLATDTYYLISATNHLFQIMGWEFRKDLESIKALQLELYSGKLCIR